MEGPFQSARSMRVVKGSLRPPLEREVESESLVERAQWEDQTGRPLTREVGELEQAVLLLAEPAQSRIDQAILDLKWKIGRTK